MAELLVNKTVLFYNINTKYITEKLRTNKSKESRKREVGSRGHYVLGNRGGPTFFSMAA